MSAAEDDLRIMHTLEPLAWHWSHWPGRWQREGGNNTPPLSALLRHSLGRGGIHGVLVLIKVYRGASLIRNRAPLGPYSRTTPRVLWWSLGGGFL